MTLKSKQTSTRTWTIRVALLAAVIGIATLLGEAPANSTLTDANFAKISTGVLETTANGQDTSFVVYMQDQADLSAAENIKDENARGWYVYNKLTATAASGQASLREKLDAEGVSYKSYWAVNMIVAEGGRPLVEQMAARPDVKSIEPDVPVDGIQGEDGPETTDDGNAVEATEQGVTNVQGPSLWTLGFKGQGIVVANQDTGMRWTHAALRTHYRGWITGTTADNNYNWHDSIHARITTADGGTGSPATNSCGYNIIAPCDDQGHGTHTTGTTVGDDAGAGVGTGTNQIGVAPAAKWIGCRNMDAGNGRAATYTECFQFFLAPTKLDGTAADPAMRPHVMNNSWGCPIAGELCPRNVMQTIVNNSEAAGIFVEASAGNDGPNCGTVQDPPAIYESTFSTGAISGSSNALQSFSSRGTVTSDGSGRMKPDLSAPGASVRSALRTNDTSYGAMSGTSMAGPHVVGVVALLWSARPSLVRDMPRTKYVLTRAANPNVTVANNAAGCGGIATRPNNHFGWGRIDALAAYNLEPSLNQAITFGALGGKTFGDGDFGVSATASSGRTVLFAASGKCTISSGTVHITGAGSCTITASQAGLDAYSIAANAPVPYYAAPNVARTFTIAKADQTIDFAPLADKTYLDPDFDVSATASTGLAVSFSASGSCTVAGVTVHITGLGGGSCTITASQGGNDDYNAAPDVPRTFAVLDKLAPVTTASLSPAAVNGWNNSSPTVTLSADDGAGSGVASTEFRVDGGAFLLYLGSFQVTGDGIHLLEYRSTDNAGNVETTNSLTIRIDTVSPEASLQINTDTDSVDVYASDGLSGVGAGPFAAVSSVATTWGDGKGPDATASTYLVSDLAGNTITLVVNVRDERPGANGLDYRVVSIQYNAGSVIAAPENKGKYSWSTDKKTDALRNLHQTLEVKTVDGKFKLDAKYDGKKKETTKIKLKEPGPDTKTTVPGLVLIRLVTSNGGLTFQF